ncbi:MAG TPA: DUF2652 domain-containing protein [Ignavibacteria bacterium]|nr:DUF2652 domain-containing protein [Ignavibacteria bacterium]
MANNSTTILIPDISGFTEFMTKTELTHASHLINVLIEEIIKSVKDEYEVSEIEGDAVLFIKKGPPPSEKEIVESCLKIFNAFHYMRKWIEQHTICPCNACMHIDNLTLKFIAHHGQLAEIKVGNFVKQSGTEMIVAHRLLKNNIPNNEYLLITEKLLQQTPDSDRPIDLKWNNSSEEYPSIGNVNFIYTLLNEVKKNVPDPPEQIHYSASYEIYGINTDIAADFRDVYMVVKNIPERSVWTKGLLKVEQDAPEVFIGSIHQCSYENFMAVVSPISMNFVNDEISYTESFRVEESDLFLAYEFVFKKTSEKECKVSCRLMNMNDSVIPPDIISLLISKMDENIFDLKVYCENLKESLFEQSH